MLQFRQHTEQLQKTTEAVLPESEARKNVMKVKHRVPGQIG
jgi:hypothetical protein